MGWQYLAVYCIGLAADFCVCFDHHLFRRKDSAMTTQTLTPTVERKFLKRVLFANTAFSTLSSIICLVAAPDIADFIGLTNAVPIIVLAVLLLIFAFDVYLIARRTPIQKSKATLALVADFIWVVASAILLIADPFSFTTQGRWVILIIADVVAVFAILEFVGLWTERTSVTG
jgi:hypothetical protein